MSKIKILLADNSFLIRQGLRCLFSGHKDFKIVGEAEKAEGLCEQLLLYSPDVLIIDYASSYFCLDDISVIHEQFPSIHILAITNPQSRQTLVKAMENGIVSHLLKDCGKEEIIEAVSNTAKGEKFYCGKIVDAIMKGSANVESLNSIKTYESTSCEGIKLSNREIEVIRFVAEGLTNKQIADKLFLSAHTVTTHRKNIMCKLGISNTAGLVMYAVRQNLLDSNSLSFASN